MTQARTEPESARVQAPPPASQPRWLLVVVAWQSILAVMMVGGGVAIVTGALFDLAGLGLVVVVAIVLLAGAASALAVPLLLRHRHRGRAIGILLDYLVLVLAGFITLQNIGEIGRAHV